jgi:hypothetical protein
MNLITNEYNQLLIQNGTIGKLKSEDVAFLADGTSHKGKQYQNKSKFPYNCNNCGWKGHKKEDCWEEGGGKAGKGLKGWKSCRKKSKSKDNDKLKASRSNTDILKLKDDSKPDGVWLASTKDIWDEEPEPYDVSLIVFYSAKLAQMHMGYPSSSMTAVHHNTCLHIMTASLILNQFPYV